MIDHPVLPYPSEDGPTSGFAAGVATSEERAREADTDGTTSKRQTMALRWLAVNRDRGTTWHELSRAQGIHHGTASGVLSVLHKAGKIARLTERRGRSFVYVLPEYVHGRDTQPQGRTRPDPEDMQDRLESLLVQYDERGDLFGTSGAGAFFLAEFLIRHGVTL